MLAAASAVAAVSATLATIPAASDAATTVTAFAMRTSGYAVRVSGGLLPVNSGDIGFESTGCTRKAGKSNSNKTANVTVPGLGKVGATTTRSWTAKSGKTVASRSEHNVASIVLSNNPLGTLTLKAVHSETNAYHNASGFHSVAKTTLGSIVYDPVVGSKVSVPIPSPGKSVTVPGIATVTLGKTTTSHGKHSANAFATGVTVKVLASGSTVSLAHTGSAISDGAINGVFSGWSDGVDGSVLNGVSSVGRNPLTNVLCAGTRGKVKTKTLADLPLGKNFGGLIDVSGVSSGQKGTQSKTSASGYTFGRVASVSLGGGQIQIKALRAQANASWSKSKGTKVSSSGTSFGSITVNGKKVSLAQLGSALNKVNIPGLAGIKTNVVTKSAKKIEVVALQLRLLDATKQTTTVVNIGHAKFGISHTA